MAANFRFKMSFFFICGSLNSCHNKQDGITPSNKLFVLLQDTQRWCSAHHMPKSSSGFTLHQFASSTTQCQFPEQLGSTVSLTRFCPTSLKCLQCYNPRLFLIWGQIQCVMRTREMGASGIKGHFVIPIHIV